MTVTAGGHGDAREVTLLAAARAGDEHAFAQLTEPHRRAIHVHCYRMLGSFHDADDALQETLLRAWRGLDRFEPRGPLRAWLYRIATNVCLRLLERRSREPAPTVAEVCSRLQPYPDRLLEELAAPEPGPEAQVEEREAVGLAFVAAMQLLPARQRAVLVLRDVLGWSAAETADLLGGSVAAVNSSLQRARSRLAKERRESTLAVEHLESRDEADVMRRFLAAWERVDVPALMELLADDAVLTMPPEPMRVVGPDAIGSFFATVPMEGRLDRIRLLPTRANGQPALAAYVDAGEGGFQAYGVMVFSLDSERITGIVGFADYGSLLPAFDLPEVLS